MAFHARALFNVGGNAPDSRAPAASMTVADLLSALEARGTPEARLLYQALLAALVAIDR